MTQPMGCQFTMRLQGPHGRGSSLSAILAHTAGDPWNPFRIGEAAERDISGSEAANYRTIRLNRRGRCGFTRWIPTNLSRYGPLDRVCYQALYPRAIRRKIRWGLRR